jgi:SAM-dependent methyltransferase
VLDVGTGVGDVAFLAARLVGPKGEVIGVDGDAGCLEVARGRAKAEKLAQVKFLESDFRKFGEAGSFDAVTGRLVLLYQADPVAALAHLKQLLKPGGILALQDVILGDKYSFSSPRCELYHRCIDVFCKTLAAGGADMECGFKLHRYFVAAGFPAPQLRSNPLVVTRHTPLYFEYFQQFMQAIAPKMEELGVAKAADFDIANIGQQLRAEIERTDGILIYAPIVGAWCRKA